MYTKIGSSSKHHPLHAARRTLTLPMSAQRFLAAFEGFEGGFAIGASIVVALAFTDLPRHALLVTGIISIIVNGFNNASVKYSSEHYLDELDGREKQSKFSHYFMPAFIEFISYFAISFISIIPLFILGNTILAIVWCVIVTLTLLALAGWWRAYMLGMPRMRDALETTLLGAGIILVGVISGYIMRNL